MKVLQIGSSLDYVREFGCYFRTALSMAEDEARRELTVAQVDEIAEALRKSGRIDDECTMKEKDSFKKAFELVFGFFDTKKVGDQVGEIKLTHFDASPTAILNTWNANYWQHTALCFPARDGSGDHWVHGDAVFQQKWDPYGWAGIRVGLKRATLYSFWSK